MKVKLILYIAIFFSIFLSGAAVASENSTVVDKAVITESIPKDETATKDEGGAESEPIQSDVENGTSAVSEEKTTKEINETDIEDDDFVNIYESGKYQSLFFTNRQLNNIISIMKNKELGGGESFQEAFSVVDSGDGGQESSTVIFLNSILFISKDNWTIWVNDNKISSHDEMEKDLRVVSIDNSKVEFLWRVGRTKWEIMMPNFKFENSISQLTKDSFVETRFTLEPNQTFLPRTGKISEGRQGRNAPNKVNPEQNGDVQAENNENQPAQ